MITNNNNNNNNSLFIGRKMAFKEYIDLARAKSVAPVITFII